MYMQGIQAWLERICLDIKKPGGAQLFVAPVSGSLDQNVDFVPYRMTYPVEEQTRNAVNYRDAVSKIARGVGFEGCETMVDALEVHSLSIKKPAGFSYLKKIPLAFLSSTFNWFYESKEVVSWL
ncbi:hypothetical protein RYH73_02495 [Olivibacter sp. CPCC 100613]|uniref:hypothetical protein n=1 Tax=Olivibacter sp. CPCC 100613 TaxID=3079931 RepID=UPI003A04EA23